MKLNKNTKEVLKPGDVLKAETAEFRVEAIHDCKGGKQITITIINHPQPWAIGRRIYGERFSGFYGYKILKTYYMDTHGNEYTPEEAEAKRDELERELEEVDETTPKAIEGRANLEALQTPHERQTKSENRPFQGSL